MENDDLPDTRVFVSGVPLNFTSDQLGAHFAMRYQITDAVVVPGRRIGFVGFRNYTLAKNAVKYFDKSYIRMSKISVEIAKPIEINRDDGPQAAPVSQKANKKHPHSNIDVATIPSQPASAANPNPKGSSFQPYVPLTSTSTKRKRAGDEQERQEGFHDYMDTMQTSGSKPTWSNGTIAAAATNTARSHSPQIAAATDTADTADGSLKKLKKKNKKARDDQNPVSGSVVQDDSTSASNEKMRKKSGLVPKTELAGEKASKNAAPADDDDVALAEDVARRMKRKKKQQQKALAADNDSHGEEPRTEHESSNSRIKKNKEPKSSKEAKGGVNSLDDASSLDEDDADRSQLDNVRNDDDWLRARTNRVLDLVDEDELRILKSPFAVPEDSKSSSGGSEQPAEPQVLAVSVPQHNVERLLANARLFIRNLPYSASEADIHSLFSKYGKVTEVHIVQDARASSSKGLAYIQYGDSSSAACALQQLDGASFQGRLLHILPALDKKSQKLDDYELSKLSIKKQKEIQRRREAARTTFSWNSLYVNPDAVLSSVADRLGVTKAELLDPTSSDAAVKQAHAETHVIQETKSYLTANGINIDAFRHRSRDDKTLVVKNFPFGVTTEDLRQLFEPHGRISQLLMPPTGTMAIVEYSDAREATTALKQLAYKNLKGSVLFLEKGPRDLFNQEAARQSGEIGPSQHRKDSLQRSEETSNSLVESPSSTIFVRNLDFATTTAGLKEAFEPLAGFLSARVKTKIDPKRPAEVLSMGFGFVDFRTPDQAQAAISVMNGHKLNNRELVIEASRRVTDIAEERHRDDIGKKLEAQKTKVVIKNLPFEASKKDVRSLFGAYGQLRSVRLPKKFDHSTRGFAFADFVSAKEAENAIAALTNTHLLGRRLVLEFASGDAIDPEDEIRAMEQRVSQQTDIVNLSKMTGSGRKKFTVNARDDEDL